MARMLEGKRVLITGATGGIGAATAHEFAARGAAAIGVHYSSAKAKAKEMVDELKAAGSEALAVQADVSRRESAAKLVKEVATAFGGLDAVIAYAGYPFDRDDWDKPFETLTEEILMRPIRVDLLGSAFTAQAAIPYLKESGSGRIVFVSSTPAVSGDVVGISYLMAKGGILSLTKALAWYLGPENIHVNCLVLGSIDTSAMAPLTEEERRDLAEETALKRLGDPAEVARKAAFLASDDASFITGSLMAIDGGFLMRK
ncbi:MAG: SDR family NAD(P)-dependent oxidoreductase [Thermoplasmata archaeon]